MVIFAALVCLPLNECFVLCVMRISGFRCYWVDVGKSIWGVCWGGGRLRGGWFRYFSEFGFRGCWVATKVSWIHLNSKMWINSGQRVLGVLYLGVRYFWGARFERMFWWRVQGGLNFRVLRICQEVELGQVFEGLDLEDFLFWVYAVLGE